MPMILILIFVLLIVIFSSSIRPKDGWKDGYISKEQSRSVEGIFVILIFLGHVVMCFDSYYALDYPYLAVKVHLDQAVVAMFLFYSGFGMMQSLQKKGTDYLKKIPLKRFLPLLIKFEIATVIYLAVRMIIKDIPDKKTLILSFTGWESLGNYGWYIFVMLSLYVLFCLSFFISHKVHTGREALTFGALILTLFSIIFMLLMCSPGNRERWFYDTVIIFCLGAWYSIFKEKAEAFLSSNLRYMVTCIICLAVYVITSFSRVFRDMHYLIHELWMICFTIAVLLITVKISIKSKVLDFFGTLAFPMLMFQGLPFLIFSHLNLQSSPYLFVLLSFTVTVLLSFTFNKISEAFKRKDNKINQKAS